MELNQRRIANALRHGFERGGHVLRRGGIRHNDGGHARDHFLFQGHDDRGIHGLHVGVALFLGRSVLDIRRLAGDVATPSDQFVGHKDVQNGQYGMGDRKSTRLNSSHRCISYAVFCLKKKKNTSTTTGELTSSSLDDQPPSTNRMRYITHRCRM